MEFGGNVDEFVPSLMIRSLCHARPLPSHFTDDQPTCYSLMRSMGGVERCCAAKKRPATWMQTPGGCDDSPISAANPRSPRSCTRAVVRLLPDPVTRVAGIGRCFRSAAWLADLRGDGRLFWFGDLGFGRWPGEPLR